MTAILQKREGSNPISRELTLTADDKQKNQRNRTVQLGGSLLFKNNLVTTVTTLLCLQYKGNFA